VALDVLRTLGRVPSAAYSLHQELSAASGDIRYDKHCAKLAKKFEWLKGATEFEKQAAARSLVEDVARALQASCLLTGDKSDIADVFCETRLGNSINQRSFFGALPPNVASPAICENIMDRFRLK
jgi:putative acyl-CoA dehydrogenase